MPSYRSFFLEEWRDVEGFSNHKVSKDGKVLCISTKRISYGSKTPHGYRVISSGVGGKTRQIMVHRAVYIAFVGVIPTKLMINHKDGNKENNSVSNLELVTASENCLHAVMNNLQPNLLTKEQIDEAISLYKSGIKLKEISKIMNIPSRKLSEAFTGKNYKYAVGIALYKGKPSGERVHNSKLTKEKVRLIREKLSQGFSGVEVAKEFGVYPTTIHKIKHKQIWNKE
jgi:hypothetical protein